MPSTRSPAYQENIHAALPGTPTPAAIAPTDGTTDPPPSDTSTSMSVSAGRPSANAAAYEAPPSDGRPVTDESTPDNDGDEGV